MGLKDKLGMPYDKEKRTGHNGKKYTIYKYKEVRREPGQEWSGMMIILFLAFWGFVIFQAILL